jgi:hypothetical protein
MRRYQDPRKPLPLLVFGYYTVPCDENFPSIAFNISDTSMLLPSTSFKLGPVQFGLKECVGGIVGAPTTDLTWQWLLGDIFLENYYTIFDYANLKIGFANLVGK